MNIRRKPQKWLGAARNGSRTIVKRTVRLVRFFAELLGEVPRLLASEIMQIMEIMVSLGFGLENLEF